MPVWVKRFREREIAKVPRGVYSQWERDKLIKCGGAPKGKVGDVAFPRVNVSLVQSVKS